jgi:hypothetical protein
VIHVNDASIATEQSRKIRFATRELRVLLPWAQPVGLLCIGSWMMVLGPNNLGRRRRWSALGVRNFAILGIALAVCSCAQSSSVLEPAGPVAAANRTILVNALTRRAG